MTLESRGATTPITPADDNHHEPAIATVHDPFDSDSLAPPTSLAQLDKQYVMTQVFAAMNFRLSEEYTKIELPSVEAKER